MAGDWIKMRGNLWDDPRVNRLVDLTDSSEAAVIGALYWLWATADQHSEDGLMPSLTVRGIDRKTGVAGFGAALVSIGWLTEVPDGVCITHFEEHNGSSAKSRLMTAKRVALHKANAEVTVKPLAEDKHTVSDALPREREEKEKEITTKSKSKAERATRLSPDWVPTDADVEFCKTKRPDLSPQRIGEEFRDYWLGAGKPKADWAAVWRVWVMKQHQIQPRAGPVKPSAFQQKHDQRQSLIERIQGKKNEQPTIIDIN